MNRLQSGTRVYVTARSINAVGTLVSDFDGTGPVILQDAVLTNFGIYYVVNDGFGAEELDNSTALPSELFIPLGSIKYVTKLPEVQK